MPQYNFRNELGKPTSLKEFVFNFKENRPYLISIIAVIVLQLLLYKYLYPYANFIIGDSFSYIREAKINAQIDTYPIGYPMFIRFFSAFSSSDTVLVAFQYLLLQAAALSLVFTLFYFFLVPKSIKILLIAITLLNPLAFVLANTISSDNYFWSLSLIWITLLIWVVYQSSWWAILAHSMILFLLLTVRFNALFYPIISLFAFFLSKENMKQKIMGALLFIVLMGIFIIYNQKMYYQLSGKKQMSVFSGWLMANNGLYAYRQVPIGERKPVPAKFERLDSAVRAFFKYADSNRNNIVDSRPTNYEYMWVHESPLWTYCVQETKLKEGDSDLKARSIVGPLYNDYGMWLITHYPYQFLQFLIKPNLKKWFIPPMETLDSYNQGAINVPKLIADWFRYKSVIITTRVKDPYIFEGIVRLYPIWTCIIYIAFLSTIIYYFIFKWKVNPSNLNKVVLIVTFFWIVNFCFNVFASPIQMRHVMFPVEISTIFSFLLIGLL